MDTQKITIDNRVLVGRKVKKLRAQGILPANLYGKGLKSQNIQIGLKEFNGLYKKVGETGIVELILGDKAHPALIANIQIHPVTNEPTHVDFKQVNLKEKVRATVPIVLAGEAPAEKNGEGTVIQQLLEVYVEALPMDLPDEFQLDVTKLEKVDDALTLNNLIYDKTKIEVEGESEQIVAKVVPPQEEDEEPEVATPAEVEIIGEEKEPDEGGAGEEKKEPEAQKEEDSK